MIYIGSQYFRAPTPAEVDWERDVAQAKAYGLDYLRFWLMWNWYSRRDGEYDFSSLQRLLDICAKEQMKVIMLTNLESAPAWLVKKYPEAIYRDATGGQYPPDSVGNTPGGGFPGLCFHHAGVRAAGTDYIARMASAVKDHPAIECWEPHNEPMFEPGRYNNHMYCYCDHTIDAFRGYLQRKYDHIDALNADWRRNYGAFDEVQPPRRRGMYNDWMDWRMFALDTLIGTLEWRIATIRENDPNHYVIIHTRGGSGVTRNLAKEGIDDYRMAALVEKYGTAAFPQCGPEHEYFIAMAGARCAARGKEFWMSELQSGPYGMGVHRNDAEPICEFCGSGTMEGTIDKKTGTFDPGEVSAERLRMWSWSGIAQGAKGVLYWQYRNESFGLEYGFGLTNLDGTPHDRLRAVKDFHDILRANETLFENAVLPDNKIALAWDPRNDIVNWTALGCTDAVKNSIKGIHKALWHADFPIDIVRLDTEVVDDDFSRYQVIYLPFSPFIAQASAEKLKQFVANGGLLIAEGSAAQFDDTMGVTPIVPGQGLDELFGCRRADIRTAPAVFMPKLQLGGLPIETRMHKESLQPQDGARVIGTFSSGEIAAVEHDYGKGRAIYLGTNPFLSYCVNADPNLITWMHMLHGDITRHAYTDVPDIVARVLISGKSKLVFLMNTLAQPTVVQLTIPCESTAMPAVRELVSGSAGPAHMDGQELRIDEELGAYGTRVYVVD